MIPWRLGEVFVRMVPARIFNQHQIPSRYIPYQPHKIPTVKLDSVLLAQEETASKYRIAVRTIE